MKITKKITALFLAMMMALSIMAMPAVALEDTIQPRIPVPVCPDCNVFMINQGPTMVQGVRYFYYTCPNCSNYEYVQY